MEREIKFKIWDQDSKRFIPGDWSISSISGVPRGKYGEKFDSLIPLQYTGLKDKNGKEIYEGDIVRADGTVAEVIYSERWCEFKIVAANSLGFYNSIEVIGNIHENPELLETKEQTT